MKKALIIIFISFFLPAFGQSPGGVSANHIFWLKGDAGVNPSTNGSLITSWDDQVNANDASPSGTAGSFFSNLINFNPGVDFSATTGGFTMANNAGINTTTNNDKSYTIAFTTGSDITTRQLIFEEGGGTHGLNIYILDGELYTNLWVSSANNSGSIAIETNTSYTLSFVFNGTNNRIDAFLNGGLAYSDITAPGNLPGHTGAIGLGIIVSTTQYNPGGDIASGDPFAGSISEFAYYNATAFSTVERERIESYLGIKYGISQNHNYESSSGANIWNTTTNSGYNNGIAGIGRDNTNSDINQKQSKSQSSSALLTVGLGSIFSDNASNTNTFSNNNDFLVWGHNGASGSFNGSNGPPNELILDRIWKVQETGTVGNVLLRFPANTSSEAKKLPDASALNILVDSDGDFSLGAVSSPMVLVGNNWEISLDLSNGDFITLSVPGAALSVTANGNESGPTHIIYTVTLPNINSTGSAITYDFDDDGTGSATSGFDYVAIPAGQKISVADGQQSGSLTINVIDDGLEENQETFSATISNPSNLTFTIGAANALATITDNDNATPGGLSTNLIFWFRANKGSSSEVEGTSAATWTDQSGGLRNASQVGGSPTYRTNLSNFNPSWDFTGTTGGMTMDDDDDINLSNSLTTKFYTIAFRLGADVNTRQILYEQGGGSNGQNVYINDGKIYANWWVGSTDYVDSADVVANQDYIVTYVYNGASGLSQFYLNGGLAGNVTGVPSVLARHTGDVGIGVIDNETQYYFQIDVPSGDDFDGHFHEMIYYNNQIFSAADRLKLESYLALKYGITLSSNYTSTSALVYWDATANSGFSNDIAGIGIDGLTGLQQKQSKSLSNDALVTIALKNIEETNIDNTGSFGSDESFLVWGNDDGTLGGISSNSEVPAASGIVDRLLRTWKIVETGTIDTVQFAIPKAEVDGFFSLISFANLKLKVASNSALTADIIDIPLTVENINGVDHYTCKHDFSGTQYFTIVQSGFILWNGTEWRGGLSSITDHAPSDELGDSAKTLFIQSGSDASLKEATAVNQVEISAGAVLNDSANSCLIVYNTFTNNGTFRLLADEYGYAQYKGPSVTATFQQYIPNEGWHSIASPFTNVQWDDISFLGSNALLTHPFEGVSLDTCNYCNLWYYDPSSDIGSNIGISGSNAFGTWRSSVNETENFLADKGWIMYLDASSNFGDAPWTISVTGILNDGPNTQTINENNGGWNLVANPYSSALDWDLIEPSLAAQFISTSYYIWDDNIGQYATYNTLGAINGATSSVAPFQSFFIQTATEGAQNSGDVFRTLSIDTSYQPDPCSISPKFYKNGRIPIIKLQSKNKNSNSTDETVISFFEGSSVAFSPYEDSRKLLSPRLSSPSLYSLAEDHKLAVNVRPFPFEDDSIYLDLISVNNAQIEIEALELPSGINVYLEDLYTGRWYNLENESVEFQHRSHFNNRFLLHFSRGEIKVPEDGQSNPVFAFVRDNKLVFKSNRNINNLDWTITSSAGKKVALGNFSIGRNEEKEVGLNSFSSGVYFIQFNTAFSSNTQKVFIKSY